MTSSPYPVLRSLPTNKAKLPASWQEEGGGLGEKGRRQRTRAEQQEPLSIGPAQRLSKSWQLSQLHTWRSQCTVTEGTRHREELGILCYWDISILTCLSFVYFKFSPLPLGPVQNHSNFLYGRVSYICGVTGPHAHTCASPLLRMSGCTYEGTKAVLEKLQAATPPTPFTCRAGVSFPLGSLMFKTSLMFKRSCGHAWEFWPLAPGGNTK